MTTFVRLSRLAGALALVGALQACASEETQAAQNAPIARQVQSALDRNPAVTGSDFKVTAEGNQVSLSGVVSNPYEEQEALATARRVPGVDDVIDNTKVDNSDTMFGR